MFTLQWWNSFFIHTLFIFSTFSIAGSEASIVMLYLLSLLRLVLDRKQPKLESPILGVMLLYAAVVVLSGFLNEYEVDHLEALRDNWRLLLPFVLLPILESKDENRLLWVYFWFLSLLAVYGIIQLFTGVDWFRPEAENLSAPYRPGKGIDVYLFHAKGNFTHHLTYGGMLLLCSPLLSSLAFCKNWSTVARMLVGGMSIILWCAATATLGRSIWLGSVVAVLILLLRFSPKITIACIVIIGVMLPTALLFPGDNTHQNQGVGTRLDAFRYRLTSGFSLTENRDRLLMWESASRGIQDHFWLGIGHNSDQMVMTPYRDEIRRETEHRFQNPAGTGVHNIYLQTWLNYGFFGLLSYLGIWAMFYRTIFRGLKHTTKFDFRNSIFWGAMSGVSGFLVAGIFENNFRDGEVQTTLLLVFALVLSKCSKKTGRFHSRFK